ncbi:unnamed protein product [Caenorhabditis brenneri]
MTVKTILFLILILTPSLMAQESTTTPITITNTTGYSTLCTSCVTFLEQLPGFLENYSPVTGINAETLCTTLAKRMPSVSDPCFKLFAEYWPNSANATTIQICESLYFC